MDGVEQQAVAAEGHDDVAVAGVDQVVAGRELGLAARACGELDATQAMRALDPTQDTGAIPPRSISKSTPGTSAGSCCAGKSPEGSGLPRKSCWLMLIATSGRAVATSAGPEPIGYDLDH